MGSNRNLHPALGLLLLAALGLAVACAPRPPVRRWTREEVRQLNRNRLARLEIGMAQTVALDVMGSETFHGASAGRRLASGGFLPGDARQVLDPPGKGGENFHWQDRPLKNPMRKELRRIGPGRVAEIFFYYAEPGDYDDEIEAGELVPVVFVEQRLAGIGWDFLRERFGWGPERFR